MSCYSLYRFLLSIIYPNRCAVCGDTIVHDEYFCLDCEVKIKLYSLEADENKIACCEYSGLAKDLILNAKFHANGYAIAACAKMLYDRLCGYNFKAVLVMEEEFSSGAASVMGAASAMGVASAMGTASVFDNIDVIAFIPSRRSSIKERGYCITEMLANDISRLSEKPFLRLLKVKDYKTPQKELSSLERAQNLKGVFSAVKNYGSGSLLIKDKNILLIDDISTTGSTLNEAEKVLYELGSKFVVKAAFAKTVKLKKV